MAISRVEMPPVDPRPSLAGDRVTDVNSVCRGVISFLRSRGVDIPAKCSGGACLQWDAQEKFDDSTVKSYLPVLMGRALLDRLKAIPPQPSPEPTAF